MPVMKLTRRNVEAIEPVHKPVIYYDKELKGFGLRVMPSGVGSWIAEYRPGAGGRGVAKKRVKLGGLDKLSPEKAREAAERLLASTTLGADPAKAKADERAGLSFRELAERYISDHVKLKRKGATADYYTGILDIHITPHIGTLRAVLVTRADVQKMHAAIAKKREDGKGGKFIANRALAIVSATFGWAEKIGLVPSGHNPAAKVEKYREEGRERFLTTEEIARLGKALHEAESVGLPYEVDEAGAKSKHAPKPENRRTRVSPHVTAAVRLLMLTGCRVSEILNLRWAEIDFERGIAFLPDSKTGKKPVLLSGAALAVLATLPRVGKYVVASDSAATEDEKPRYDIKRPWTAISKRAGLEGLRLHDLRHTFASIGAGSGLGLPAIGALLGHTNAKTTQRYAHLATDASRRAADLIAGQIDAAMNGGGRG